MERVTGIGGFFFRAADPEALGQWYAEQAYPNGRFATTKDPEGNPIQLWEPTAEEPARDTTAESQG